MDLNDIFVLVEVIVILEIFCYFLLIFFCWTRCLEFFF